MRLIADTNILVASLLKDGGTRRLLFSGYFEVFVPDRTKFEILRHKKEFMKKGTMDAKQFELALKLLLERVAVVSVGEYKSLKQKAISACPLGHDDDWPFLALAIKMECPLWSQDFALKKQGVVCVYSTSELANAPE